MDLSKLPMLKKCSVSVRETANGDNGTNVLNAGDLICWNSTQSWFVPQTEHFPTSKLPSIHGNVTKTVGHGIAHNIYFTLDISTYGLNEEISKLVTLYQILQELAKSLNKGVSVCGMPPSQLSKRSANNFVDAIYFPDVKEIIIEYNGQHFFHGKCLDLGDDYFIDNDVIQKLLKIEKNYIVDYILLNTATLISTKHSNNLLTKDRMLVAEWNGNAKVSPSSSLDYDDTKNSFIIQIKQILGMSEVVNPNTSLKNFGLDSLMSLEIKELLAQKANIYLEEREI